MEEREQVLHFGIGDVGMRRHRADARAYQRRDLLVGIRTHESGETGRAVTPVPVGAVAHRAAGIEGTLAGIGRILPGVGCHRKQRDAKQ